MGIPIIGVVGIHFFQFLDTGGTEYLLPKWDKKCYFMGLASSDEGANPNVVQTIGWNSIFGGMGVFDPLSDNPVTQRTNQTNTQ